MRFKVTVAIVTSVLVISTGPTFAAPKTFKNCTELNKVYPGGVALPRAINSGGETKLSPKFDKGLYEANRKSDRDKDGIACEK